MYQKPYFIDTYGRRCESRVTRPMMDHSSEDHRVKPYIIVISVHPSHETGRSNPFVT